MHNAYLYIDEFKFPIKYLEYNFRQFTGTNNKPNTRVFGGEFSFTFDIDDKKAIHLIEWMLSSTMQKNGYIEIMDFNQTSIDFKLEFANAYATSQLFHYDANSNLPLQSNVTVTSGAIRFNKDVTYLQTWNPKDPFLNNETAVTTIEEEEEKKEVEPLKFTATFERLDSYQGEFGFDWMRDNYQSICENYEKLKKEYTPITIDGKEYFVPWLSMFPNQENVKLKLTVNILEGTATDQDIIKLPKTNSIRFEPEEVKVSEANGKEIQVFCDSPLANDIKIEFLDKDDQIVGKINIFKNANHNDLHFKITPVRILRGISKESDIDEIDKAIDEKRGFGDNTKDINTDFKELEKYLNTQSLNQALLQCKIENVYDVIIDENLWLKKSLIVKDRCVFKGNLLPELNKEFQNQHPEAFKNRGITAYLSPLAHSSDGGEHGAGGYGNLGDIDAKGLVIFKTNLHDKATFAHEIAHVAGLEHSFKEEDNYTIQDLNEDNEYILEVDRHLNYMLENNFPEKEISEFWSERKKGYKSIRAKLNIHYRNLHKFEQSKTENFMDYYNSEKSFWMFQWKALQDDIIKFYNIK